MVELGFHSTGDYPHNSLSSTEDNEPTKYEFRSRSHSPSFPMILYVFKTNDSDWVFERIQYKMIKM